MTNPNLPVPPENMAVEMANSGVEVGERVREAPWNETNPEWWREQVMHRIDLGGDIAWRWLVNEWMAVNRMCCRDWPRWIITTAAGEVAMCAQHAGWYLTKGEDIYPRRVAG